MKKMKGIVLRVRAEITEITGIVICEMAETIEKGALSEEGVEDEVCNVSYHSRHHRRLKEAANVVWTLGIGCLCMQNV